MFKVVLFVAAVFAGSSVFSQRNEVVIQYINTYKQLAVDEMLRTGVPASITLAQGIHETEAGRSDLVTRSNNHFGIKCKTGWQGDRVFHDDDARGECFRSYSSASESYIDHSNFLKNSQRYAPLFELDPADYKGWAFGLKKAGYATNVKYSHILIKLIEDYNLQQYSLIALGKFTPEEEALAGIIIRRPGQETGPVGGPAVTQAAVIEPVVPVVAVTYPSGEFTINKTRVVFAKAGTSLLSIAKLYDVSLGRLFDFNDLDKEDVLIKDQLIFLQRKRKTGAEEFHVVQPGETLYSISQSEGIRLESLLEYNHLDENSRPAIGERLYLQKRADAAPRLASDIKEKTVAVLETPAAAFSVHKVQAKETLYGIAKNYGTTTERIMEWNKLQGTGLKQGQELIIYKN
jgi:LysM repeat protein